MRFRLRPSIGNTIFALAVLLIALMAVVAAINSGLSVRVGGMIGTISRTYIPIYGMLARAHVRSLEQSLALRQAAIAALSGDGDIAAFVDEQKERGALVAQELTQARQTIAAQAAETSGVEDRVLLGRLDAQIEAAIKARAGYEREVAEFVAALRSRDMSAAEAHLGRLDAARDAQNDGLEQARRESLAFATGAVELTRESGRDVIRLTLATLAFAVLLGLLMAFWITRRVVGSIRRLVVATEAAEKGHYETDLPVVSRDEIGRLSQAFNAMLAELRLKTRIRETFGRYLDPKVVEGLLDRPDLVAAAGERRLMTVAFADMRGFTRLSEQVTPALLVSVLNRYLTVLTEEIRSRNGVVDKYIGDAVMSFWGPPFVSEADEARLACETALAQARRFAQFQAELPDLLGIRSFTPDLGLRIGIATGEVVAGSVGSATAMNFTVMGDAVNVASRLEALNKVYGTVVLVSEATARLVQGEFALREVDRVVVLGRETPLSVFELVGRPDDVPADTERALRLYETGLAAYRRKAWDDAAAAFRACLELRPADGPATALLARVTQFAGKPTPADWEGTWVAREK